MKKYTFSPFNQQTDPLTDNWSLENVTVELVKCHDTKYLEIGLKDKKL